MQHRQHRPPRRQNGRLGTAASPDRCAASAWQPSASPVLLPGAGSPPPNLIAVTPTAAIGVAAWWPTRGSYTVSRVSPESHAGIPPVAPSPAAAHSLGSRWEEVLPPSSRPQSVSILRASRARGAGVEVSSQSGSGLEASLPPLAALRTHTPHWTVIVPADYGMAAHAISGNLGCPHGRSKTHQTTGRRTGRPGSHPMLTAGGAGGTTCPSSPACTCAWGGPDPVPCSSPPDRPTHRRHWRHLAAATTTSGATCSSCRWRRTRQCPSCDGNRCSHQPR